MTEIPNSAATTREALEAAQLYVGDADIEIHSFESPLGSLAVAVAVSSEKSTQNEDSAAIVPVNGDCLVLAVADGVGGLPTGRKASNTAVEKIREALRDVEDEDARVRTAILDGIEAANRALLEMGTGTATTLTVADIRDNQIRTYHVGDSAAWLVGQRGVIKLQTTPHSPVGFAVEAGLIDENEALNHEELHEISNVVGSNDMRIEIGPRFPIAARDTVLLASDGLFDNVLQDEIIEIIRKGPVAEAVETLWDLARRRMLGEDDSKPSKPDDFSAILFRPVGH
ncbi:MAG: protein phosphatase 2C domain-containing protein [Gammaproteobacteria bacterium]|nr:protein phosphatase 2C domain-containing protein [Gammaproteobacteria bacterium]MDP7093014.1 protein phosphatase 2C domain-containing protein [Gammaproteobacteria bacterium]MDP7270483.1 protein phosphatase 2C domain-containing protein [Gammaproteobacteria bacterium]HJP04018.1 protein phosphatase 2C domain-containing protein [Gammaproteobacteria bacterium]